MTLWDLRQWIESRTPWWTIPAVFFVAVLVYGWLEFRSYGKRKFK